MEYEKIIEILKPEYNYAKVNFIPIIRDNSAKFLYDFVKENKIKRVLEIGTAIGYSGNIILSAGCEELLTVDINADSLEVAKKVFKKCGNEDKVKIFHEDASKLIEKLVLSSEHFDLIFLDGAKGQYFRYLENLTKLIGTSGIILADNVLLHGMVESKETIPHKKRTMVVNLRKYLDMVSKPPFETELIRIDDGMAITKYKGE